MFIILDGDMKIFGVFDGHGVNGNEVSSFAASMMVEFIRNIDRKFFKSKNLEVTKDKQIKIRIKHCFKFVQKKLKQQYRRWLEEQIKA